MNKRLPHRACISENSDMVLKTIQDKMTSTAKGIKSALGTQREHLSKENQAKLRKHSMEGKTKHE